LTRSGVDDSQVTAVPSGRASRALDAAPAALVALAGAAVALLLVKSPGDYGASRGWVGDDPAPAINALVEGRPGDFFALHPWMGSVSLALRWPFAALGHALGAGELTVYKLGAVPCLLALVVLAAALDRVLAGRGRPLATRLVVAGGLLLNPVTFNALSSGHPEELLTTALCVGALLAAGRGSPLAAGVLLGVAIATKQWALVAVGPVLVATRGRWLASGALAAVTAVALTLPLPIVNPQRFAEITREAAQPAGIGAANVWAPFAVEHRRTFSDGVRTRTAVGYDFPDGLGSIPRPAILIVPLLLSLLYARRVGEVTLEGVSGLLALAFLARCALDPVNLEYYYVPFVAALALHESLRRPELPALTVLSIALIWVTFEHVGSRAGVTAVWAAWAIPAALLLALELFAPRRLDSIATRLRRRTLRAAA
jgi:hypothetical protein